MYKNYEECHLSNDRLRQYTWRYTMMDDLTLVLDEFTQKVRETTRHRKFHLKQRWSRLMQRDNTIENPPPIPDWVKKRVLDRARADVKFKD